jgi:hypothetical protein
MLNGTAYDGKCKSMRGASYDSKLWGIGRIKGVKEGRGRAEREGGMIMHWHFHNE